AVGAYRSPALGDPPMHLGNVTTMDISNFRVLAELVRDLNQDLHFVPNARFGDALLWQMICSVAVNEVLDGGRCAPLTLVARRIDAAINLLAQVLRFLTGSGDGPARKWPDGEPALPPIQAIVDEEALAAARIRSDSEAGGLLIVIPPHLRAGQVAHELVAK